MTFVEPVGTNWQGDTKFADYELMGIPSRGHGLSGGVGRWKKTLALPSCRQFQSAP